MSISRIVSRLVITMYSATLVNVRKVMVLLPGMLGMLGMQTETFILCVNTAGAVCGLLL